MADFQLQVAGYVAAVSSIFESTPAYFRPYLTRERPDFSITVSGSDVEFERKQLLEEARQEGFRPRNFPEPYLERAAIQRGFAEFLFDRDTLLFHGSAVAVDGLCYLFTARSGTGKSTHTRLWRQLLGDRAVIVNDDKPFLRITPSGVLACGSPWSGKHGLDANITVPLKGICMLERGAENRIRQAQPRELLDMLRSQAYCPQDPGKQGRHLELVEALAARTGLWHMQCNKELQAAAVAYRAMSANQAE